MSQPSPSEVFEQLREASERQREQAAEAARLDRQRMDAYFRRAKILHQLSNLLAGGTVDVSRLSSLMIDYAGTLPAEWLQARVKRVQDRLDEMAATGREALDARLKGVLLHLLAVAGRGDSESTEEVFRAALACDADVVERFRLTLVNWLDDKVVTGWPPLPEELVPAPTAPGSEGGPAALEAAALPLVAADTTESSAPVVESGTESGMTWQEAATRLEQLRSQGESWTSQREMASRFGCSPATVNKAIQESPLLRAWSRRETAAAPRAQGINDVVLDRTSQQRDLAPEDEAAIREYIETADPDTKAWFLALSTEDQLSVINDPDRHQRILGRRA
jgi:hypothetical protein